MRSSEKTTWVKVRKFFNDLHLWAGLSGALIVIVVCFSGTVYVFNTEIREMASPELYSLSNPCDTPLKAEVIVKKVEEHTGGKVQTLKIPFKKDRTWHVTVKMNPDPEVSKPTAGGRPGMGTAYAVDPYSGRIIGDVTNEKNGTTEFMRAMFSLHRWLLLDRIEEPIFGELPNRKLGSYITGTATILFTFGVLSGLIIWFPRKLRSWKQGLRIKWNAKWKRLNHDLHNTLSFYSLIFLFLMGVTGPQWSFPWYREALQKILGTYRADAPRPKTVQSKLPGPSDKVWTPAVEDYMVFANKVLDYDGDYTLALPRDSSSAVALTKARTGFFAPAAADRIMLDRYTGAVLETDIFSEKPFNERIAGSIKALHLGDVYGMSTKILYFLACLVATSLPVTGTIIWISKLQKKRRKSVREELKIETIRRALHG